MVTPTVITQGSPLATGPLNVSATNATTTLHPQRVSGNKNAASRSLDMEKLSPCSETVSKNIIGAKQNA